MPQIITFNAEAPVVSMETFSLCDVESNLFFFSFYSLTYDNLKLLVPFIWGSFLLNSLDLLLYAVNVALFFFYLFLRLKSTSVHI